MELNKKQAEKINHTLGNRPMNKQEEETILKGLQTLLKVTGRTMDEGVEETPYRMMKALLEGTRGYDEDPRKHLEKTFDVHCDDLVVVKDIDFTSYCEHHVMPFFGKVHIAYIPGKRITGLSKFGRLVDGYAKRLQVQERLTQDIANAIEEVLEPAAVAVYIEAEHTCMTLRGIAKPGAKTVTTVYKGSFAYNTDLRKEFLNMIK